MSARKFLRQFILPTDLICDILGTRQYSRILDVGAGTGLFLETMHQRGIIQSGLGIETKPGFHKVINSNLSISGIDGLKDSDRFDLITFVDVLHHVQDWQSLIGSYADQYLSEGGCVFIKDMSPDNWFCKNFNRLHDLIFAGELIHEAHPEDIKNFMAEKYELNVQSAKRIGPYDHYLLQFTSKP